MKIFHVEIIFKKRSKDYNFFNDKVNDLPTDMYFWIEKDTVASYLGSYSMQRVKQKPRIKITLEDMYASFSTDNILTFCKHIKHAVMLFDLEKVAKHLIPQFFICKIGKNNNSLFF